MGLSEGTSASVAELCAHAPSTIFLFGCALLLAAALIVAIRAAWAIYVEDITAFYVAAGDGAKDGPLSSASIASCGTDVGEAAWHGHATAGVNDGETSQST